jgi:hypothetical protein
VRGGCSPGAVSDCRFGAHATAVYRRVQIMTIATVRVGGESLVAWLRRSKWGRVECGLSGVQTEGGAAADLLKSWEEAETDCRSGDSPGWRRWASTGCSRVMSQGLYLGPQRRRVVVVRRGACTKP